VMMLSMAAIMAGWKGRGGEADAAEARAALWREKGGSGCEMRGGGRHCR